MDKEACEQVFVDIVEAVDDKLPVVGPLMDLPFVNEMEKKAVKVLLDIIWEWRNDEWKLTDTVELPTNA